MAVAERPGAWRVRLPSAAAAAAVTALLLLPFLTGPPPAGTAAPALRSTLVEVRLQAVYPPASSAPSMSRALTPPQVPPVRRARPPSADRLALPSPPVPQTPLGPGPAPDALATPGPAVPPAGPPAVSEPVQAGTPARPPLLLDAATLGRAARQSGGEFRRLAESSGAYVGDPPAAAPERFEQGVRQAGKPDCLRPGGSLLSAAVIAYEMLADRCSAR